MPPTHPKLIVGIGASAGGLQPIEQFFRQMPTGSGCAFLILQHLSQDHPTHMPELLARTTTMPVHLVEQDCPLVANHIYVLAPGTELTVDDNTLVVSPRPPGREVRHTIDTAFQSLAQSHGDRIVAILFSGLGDDGSKGIQDVYDAGGLVLVQDRTDAEFPDMPQSALETDAVHHELMPESMPACLLAHLRRLDDREDINPPGDHSTAHFSEADFSGIIHLLQSNFHIDLAFYKRKMLERRIARRLKYSNKSQNLAAYHQRLSSDRDELNALYLDILIGVTDFFRDPDAFSLLERKFIPGLFEALAPERDLRVWICGCSTGEEAYSVAILFFEAFEKAGLKPRLKLIATDISREAIARASEGIYPADDLKGLPPALRDKYFTTLPDGRFAVTPALRKGIVFSIHDVLTSPAFTQIDLVLCRNLLIYFRLDGQRRAISAFHFALRKGGVLMLGPSEGLGPLGAEFDTLDRQWKIFAKNSNQQLMREYRAPLTTPPPVAATAQAPIDLRMANVFSAGLARLAYAGVLINDRFDAVQTFGKIREFLDPPIGIVSAALHNMMDGTLKIAVQAAIAQAQKGKVTCTVPGLNIAPEDESRLIDLRVEPIEDGMGTRYYWVFFNPSQVIPAPEARVINPPNPAFDDQIASHIRQLELELEVTKEALQATVLQLEINNEELQSTNEELLASNEELQSSNEEINSVNEELYIVNAELSEKIDALDQARSDLSNLIDSTDIGILFLDLNFAIQLFTPQALRIFNLLPHDIGRDLRDLVMLGNDRQLFTDIAALLADHTPRECAVDFSDSFSFTRRISLYRNVAGALAGVVVSYIDVTAAVKAERALETVRFQMRALAENSSDFLFMTDVDRRIVFASPGALTVLGIPPGQLGTDASDLVALFQPADQPLAEENLINLHHSGAPLRCTLRLPRGDETVATLELNTQALFDGQGRFVGRTGSLRDVSWRAEYEAELQKLAKALQSVPDGVYLSSGFQRCPSYVNPAFAQLTGLSNAQIQELGFSELLTARFGELLAERITAQLVAGESWHGSSELSTRPDIAFKTTLDETIMPLMDRGQLGGVIYLIRDITALKLVETQLREEISDQVRESQTQVNEISVLRSQIFARINELELANQSKSMFLANVSHELRTPLNAISGFAQLLTRKIRSTEDLRYLEHIENAASHLLALINDIIEISRSDSGKLILRTQAFSVEMLCQDALSAVEVAAHAKGLTLAAVFEDGIRTTCLGDPLRIKQCLINLLSNAVKFTDHGAVTLTVRLRTMAGASHLRFEITDTGTGIALADQADLFTPFSRVLSNLGHQKDGTGLGLVITKQLVVAMAGCIGVESQGAGGATFWFEIPFLLPEGQDVTISPALPPAYDPRRIGQTLKILIVEDEPMNQEMMRCLLEDYAATILTADNGVMALDILKQETVDLVLMDVRMPVMDGNEATRRIRGELKLTNLPIIGLSANAFEADVREALEAGMDEFLTKPIDIDSLLALLEKYRS